MKYRPPILFTIAFLATFFATADAADLGGSAWAKESKDGLAASQSGDYPRAEKFLKKALKDARRFKETDPRLNQSLGDLAQVYIAERKFDDARPLYLQVLKIAEAKNGTDSKELIEPLNDVVRVTCAGGACIDTIPYLKRLLSIRRQAFGPKSRDIPVTLLLIGEAYEKQGKYDEAINYYKQAIAAEKAKSGNSPMAGTLTRNIDRVCKEKSVRSNQPLAQH